ncbi:hypothetical protein ACVMGC_007490 [Bradyrhizobium barranii subsp. barranii]
MPSEGILLVQPGKGLAELDVVLAVGGGDRDREHRRRRLRGEQRSRRGLAARDRVAGLDRVDLGERNRVAGFGRRTLGIVGAVDGEDAGDAAAPAGGGLQRGSVVEMAGEQSRQRQLSAVLRMQRLEDVAERLLAGRHTETLCSFLDAGRLVAQGLHQAQHAVFTRGGTQQHGADLPLAQFAREIVEHRIARRLDVLEQLLHQRVVVIGELLQHREAGLLLAIEISAFERDHLGGLVLAVDERTFQREIDEALDQLALPDRDLAQHQRYARGGLECCQRLADALVGAIDLVEEQETRDLQLLQLAQDDLKLRQLLLVGLADHDRGVDSGKRCAHVVGELNGTGTIEEGVAVAHETRGGGSQADGHLVMTGLRGGVADGCSGVDAAGAGDCARSRQYCFEKCGFTALEWAHQRDAPWTSGTSDVLSHSPSPWCGARPMIGSANADALPVPEIWQASKIAAVRRCRDRAGPTRSAHAKLSTTRTEFQTLEAGGDVEADLALHAERLERDRIVGATDQCVATDTDADRGAALRAGIIAREITGAEPIDRREHAPGKRGLLGDADVEAHFADGRDVAILRQTVGTQDAAEIGHRSHDEADAGAAAAFEHADPDHPLLLSAAVCDGGNEAGRGEPGEDERTAHESLRP